ncbi:hypothetical protein NIES2101_19385 [Calothrix sp. HK-06]|nr:hypothetical protein NIES2101_19385 [Calothrix sp. HK-06]
MEDIFVIKVTKVKFQLNRVYSMHELYQAEFKRHLQAKIQDHPPLFPWETELADYPDYPDTSSMMQARNEEYSIKQSIKFKTGV